MTTTSRNRTVVVLAAAYVVLFAAIITFVVLLIAGVAKGWSLTGAVAAIIGLTIVGWLQWRTRTRS
jgi:hypothetical protein